MRLADAVQISILSGRLLIKELRYHSTNQSIRVVKFHITCRYWLWRTRELSDDTGAVGEDVRMYFSFGFRAVEGAYLFR